MSRSGCSTHLYDSDLTNHFLEELGGGTSKHRDYLANLMSWLSVTPRYTVYRVNTLSHDSNEVQDLIGSDLSMQAAARGIQKPPIFIHSAMPEVVIMGSWNISSLNLKYQEKEVIVDAACGMAVLRGAHVFAPGVKGMLTDTGPGDYVSVYADTENKCTRGLLCSFKETKYFLGNGFVRIGRNDLFSKNAIVKGIAVEMTDTRSGIPSLPLHCIPDSYALLQNLPSILSCRTLNPQRGERILDMCAAPGNKTTHLAMLMNDEGTVIAIDRTSAKVQSIKDRCQQFGITCVQCFEYDSTKSVIEMKETEENVTTSNKRNSNLMDNTEKQNIQGNVCYGDDTSFGPPFLCESFDRILLDAPCSAMGQRPHIAKSLSLKQLKSYPILQRKLFQSAVALLKPGGHLVYSTCTITVAENEHLIKWALDKFPDLGLVMIETALGGPGLANAGLSEQQKQCVRRFGPPMDSLQLFCNNYDYNQDTVGFFIAHFVKTKENIQQIN